MICPPHLIAVGGLEPTESWDRQSEDIQIISIIGMVLVKRIVGRAPEDESICA